jgi:hypothetical protein
MLLREAGHRQGTARWISVYVGRQSRAKVLLARLYADKNGQPAKLLASGSLSRVKAGTWNVIPVRATAVQARQSYWVALLAKGGPLFLRGARDGSCASTGSPGGHLWAVGSAQRAGSSGTCLLSTYVMGIQTVTEAPLSGSTGATLPAPSGQSPVATPTIPSPSGNVTAPALPTLPPVNVTPPTISGIAQQGQTLHASPGTWLDSPTSYSYQWQDCFSSSCSDITNATSSSYTLQSTDVGDTVDVVVTATNAGGSASATSAQTQTVTPAPPPPPPSNTAAPVISGTAQQGQTLSTSNGSWTNSPTSYAYQWQDCASGSCTNISGATSSTYNLQASDVGDTIDVVVKASNAGGSGSATSAQTQTVTAASSGGFSAARVSGAGLVDGGGRRVFLDGVNRAGTEYSCIHGNGMFDGTGSSLSAEDAQIRAMAGWGINSEMITLNEDCWLGINGAPAAYSNSSSSPPAPGCSASQCPYANAIENLVATDEANGIYPVISLFALAPGSTQATGHDTLTDNSHAPLFWEEVADFFKDDPYVIFRLEQEPELWYGSEADWQCWAQGDVSYSTSSVNTPPVAPTATGSPDKCQSQGLASYQTVGMQSLVNIVRGTGATNIIMLPGLAYANMFSCGTGTSPSTCGALAAATPAVTDPHSPAQLMAEADVYPEGNSCGSPACYNAVYKPIAQAMPFVAGEMGENPANGYYPTTDVDTLMNWLDANGDGYFPYAWDAWAHLVPGYGANTSPTSWWGTDYYDHINGITPPAPAQPTDGITFPWSLPSDCVRLSNGSLSPVSTSPAVSAGDDLFAVFAGQGYNGTASTVSSVSDNVNGAWTAVAQSGDHSLAYNGNTWHASYSVFELRNAKAAPSGVTLTINGTSGQSPNASGVVFDARGVSSIGASSFQSAPNNPASTETGPTLTGVPSGDVVLGLWGGYSTNETFTAPSGWNTHPNWWVSSGECAGAAMDWTQTTSTGNVTPSISTVDSSGDEDYYAAAIDLTP